LNLLFEIGTEEIPARFMPALLEDLAGKAKEKLEREKITFDKIKTYGTPRRLVLYIENLPQKQTDIKEEIKGPPANIAFGTDGKPTPAAIGFARKNNIAPEKIIVRENYAYLLKETKGKPTEKLLETLLPEIITSLPLPIAMRWGELDFKFIRPIHSIMALCGKKTIKFKLAGIQSSNKTFGHRYRKNVGQALVVCRAGGKGRALALQDFKKQLLSLGVILDQDERKEMIRKAVETAAKKAGGKAIISETLLSEVTFLVENPIVYVGSFKKEFLEIPKEVLITSMQKNQKYFAIVDEQYNLLPKFVVVTNGCPDKKVVEGNEKVLSARLADARFFFEEDKKNPLKIMAAELEKVSFLEKLGNMAEKSNRISKLSQWLAKRLKADEKTITKVARISELCKADLNSKMVYEFPELQGVMGREYAALSGEGSLVAQGIFEHYLPKSQDDALPNSLEGTIVALADRFDTIIGAFSTGYIPSGSEDPYGIRRSALGIIRIILGKKIDLLLDETIEESGKLYGLKPKLPEILTFISARLKPILLDRGIRYDVVDAALYNFNDVLDVQEKAIALNNLLEKTWLEGVIASADRLSRIAGNAPRQQVLEHDLEDAEEKELYALYLKINWEVGERVKSEKWEEAALELSKLTAPIEAFFDKVMVMHKDERLKLNRLALLKTIENLYLSVADFRKIVVQK